MDLFFIIFLFILGLIVGSFLNAVICRLKTGEKIITSRSACPYCKKKLTARDLIPVVSFILYKGKCRYCKKPISWQYPAVELATALAFAIIYLKIAPISTLYLLFVICYLLFIASILIIIFVYDVKHYIIPDKVIIPAIAVALSVQLLALSKINLQLISSLPFALSGAVIAGGFFLLLVLASSGRWMGGGDIKLGIFMGLVLGYPLVLVALFIAYISGAAIGISLMFCRKKKINDEIPFGPFLTCAMFITLLWGNQILEWYLRMLGI
jgi:prepilin signal peptidase PulO-like enzyme (type II secretory pathway)